MNIRCVILCREKRTAKGVACVSGVIRDRGEGTKFNVVAIFMGYKGSEYSELLLVPQD